LLGTYPALSADPARAAQLWALKPIVRPDVPLGVAASANPIDSFIAAEYRTKGLKPVDQADRRALARRVYLDLIGIPPTLTEQEAFLRDESSGAYEKLVDHLLASEQYGVRYGRHWLDVLRYADIDEQMIAAPGIHLWRDWVIDALNNDLPYDQFVRAQLTGYRSAMRTEMAPTGQRLRLEPRADDMFALGFLARTATGDGRNTHESAIAAVETVSTAFMGLTVGCAKCHDHFYDPIEQRNFYAMKALFDPLVPRKVILGSPTEIIAAGRARDDMDKKRAVIDRSIQDLIGSYKKKLYDERVAMLPPDVQAVIRKPENDRTASEQKTADDYYPILRIDSEKIIDIMPAAEAGRYRELLHQLEQATSRSAIPVFWTVEVDPKKELEKSYILTSGEPGRPEKNHPVEPGWPFAPSKIDFRDGRIEAFSDWLTAAENPLFARVAVNRLWLWHFGEGLQKTASDFGKLGGSPTNMRLLDWLASEFVKQHFSMKAMHRLIVTSETYKLASSGEAALVRTNGKSDPDNALLWHFPLRRLEAEPIWDSIFAAAGTLDRSIGGPSFDIRGSTKVNQPAAESQTPALVRRAAYMIRGYSSNRDITPNFLQAFDVDDGRTPCPTRTRTVTAPQALFMMNSTEIDVATSRFAERLKRETKGDLTVAVDLAYRITLARQPSTAERDQALAFLENDPARLKNLAWLLFNLDEFIYVR